MSDYQRNLDAKRRYRARLGQNSAWLIRILVLSVGWIFAFDPTQVRGQQTPPAAIRQIDLAKQQQLAIIRGQLKKAADELAFNQSAQQRTNLTEEQRSQLQNRAAQLIGEISSLRAQEQALLR